jgi:hypothetical protein
LALKQHATFLSAQPSELGLDWARPCAKVDLSKWYRSECTELSPPAAPPLPKMSEPCPKKRGGGRSGSSGGSSSGGGGSSSHVLAHGGVKKGQCFVGMQCTGRLWHDCAWGTRYVGRWSRSLENKSRDKTVA